MDDNRKLSLKIEVMKDQAPFYNLAAFENLPWIETVFAWDDRFIKHYMADIRDAFAWMASLGFRPLPLDENQEHP